MPERSNCQRIIIAVVPYRAGYMTHPWSVLSKIDCSTTKRVPIPNDTSSESSRRDVYNADPIGTDTIPTMGDINHRKSAQGDVICTVVYGTYSPVCRPVAETLVGFQNLLQDARVASGACLEQQRVRSGHVRFQIDVHLGEFDTAIRHCSHPEK